MKPVRLTITIELPPDGTPERAELTRTTLGELLGLPPAPPTIEPDRGPGRPAVRPHRADQDLDEPANVQADEPPRGQSPDQRMDGRGLYRWLLEQKDDDLKAEAIRVAKKLGYGWQLRSLTVVQAAEVFARLQERRPKWGGGKAAAR